MTSALDRLDDLTPERVRPLRRAEYERLVAEGAFDDERVELLGGVIVEMSPRDPRHDFAIERLNARLVELARGRASVRPQLSFVASDDSVPEPDLALVPVADYDLAHPTSALLVIEVANASLRKDRSIKAEIYARAGVPEYWVVDLAGRCVEVRAEPRDGVYATLATARPGDTLALRCLDGAQIEVSDFLR
jgi:Uma2 family endonuclease